MRLIDADALIRRWCGMKCGCERNECGREIEPCIVVMAIEEAPTIDRPQGKWKRYMGDIWTCTACGKSLMCDDIECNDYCPNCGAKMEQ